VRRPGAQPRWHVVVLDVVAPLVLGGVVGVVWNALAPVARVGRTSDGTLVAPSVPELGAAQDGWLALLLVVAGLVTALVVALRPGGAPLARSLGSLLLGVVATAVAVGVGWGLGPASVHDQLAVHPHGPVTSPLRLHSPALWILWPAAQALVMALLHLVASWRHGARAPDPFALGGPGPGS
jgi:hypothetical protein